MRTLILLLLVISAAGKATSQVPPDISSLLDDSRSILSLVVTVKDSVFYAGDFNGHGQEDLVNNQSLTKNVVALLVGIAIDQGFIPSADTKISAFFPELKNEPDKRKLNITIADLMNQASGLWHENLRRLNRYLRLDDPSGHVLEQPLVAEPGSTLHYNNAASHLLSVILSKATGQTTLAFASDNLFQPLDIKGVDWPKMKDGYHDGSGLLSVHMKTFDMNKLGRLILNDGNYKGKQIVSSEWVRVLLNPGKTYPAPWELSNTRYGFTFYHTYHDGHELTYGMGWGGQFLILIPGLDAAISVNQKVNDRTAIKQSAQFMGELFPLLFDWIKASTAPPTNQ